MSHAGPLTSEASAASVVAIQASMSSRSAWKSNSSMASRKRCPGREQPATACAFLLGLVAQALPYGTQTLNATRDGVLCVVAPRHEFAAYPLEATHVLRVEGKLCLKNLSKRHVKGQLGIFAFCLEDSMPPETIHQKQTQASRK